MFIHVIHLYIFVCIRTYIRNAQANGAKRAVTTLHTSQLPIPAPVGRGSQVRARSTVL